MPFRLDQVQCRNFEISSRREWMLPNGIGGYAMGTVSGANTRRYHGHLVAAIPPPISRTVLLASIEAFADAGRGMVPLSTNQYAGAIHPEGFLGLTGFEVGKEAVWTHESFGVRIEKRISMPPGANACRIEYVNVGAAPFSLTLGPLVCHKFYHHTFRHSETYPESLSVTKDRTELSDSGIPLILEHTGATAKPLKEWYYRIEHLRDYERGLDAYQDLFCPCELVYELAPGERAVLIAEAPGPGISIPVGQHQGGNTLGSILLEAANPYLVTDGKRNTILAGYPWFTDWGRDTMIALPGICLTTGRWSEAKAILLDAISQMKGGLIPNRNCEGEEPEYNTADATLWMAHSAHRALEHQWDIDLAVNCADALQEVFRFHLEGTRHGIQLDPRDGLLRQGEGEAQLTWMDAKVDGVPITPRHGKAIEINGLWIHALRVMEWLAKRLERDSKDYSQMAEQATLSFESTFWREDLGHYLDVAEPDDPSLRPNQVIAMSLPFAPFDPDHAKRALEIVGRKLLTPCGLRTLSPDDPRYRGRFEGALPELDRAYHQGTAWPWLLGPYVTALVKFTGDRPAARRIIQRAKEMLMEYGLGGIAEVYDGDVPQRPGGCPWQAWSNAEILRAWTEDLGGV